MFSYLTLCLVLFFPFEMMTPRHAQTVPSAIIVGTHSQAVPTFRVEDRICRLTRLSRSCYKAQMARIAFYVSAAEFSEIVKLAGDVPLSKWCRRKLMERMAVPVNEQAGQDRKKRLPRTEAVPVVSGGSPTPERVSPTLAACEHSYGWNECPYVECRNFKRRM